MLQRGPCSAICVRRFDDSLNSAIHITYRSSLRSSSMHEPRDPPLKVVYHSFSLLLYNKRLLGGENDRISTLLCRIQSGAVWLLPYVRLYVSLLVVNQGLGWRRGWEMAEAKLTRASSTAYSPSKK